MVAVGQADPVEAVPQADRKEVADPVDPAAQAALEALGLRQSP